MKRKRATAICVFLALVVTSFTSLGSYLSFRWDNNGPFIVAVVATAIVSFVSLLSLTQSNDEQWELTESTMRTAIAGTVVIMYLVLVGIVAFFIQGPERLPPISQMMVTSFTTIVGVVIAFYFGTSAYVQARSQGQERGGQSSDVKK